MTFDPLRRNNPPLPRLSNESEPILIEGISSPVNDDPTSVTLGVIDCTTGLAASVQSFVQAGVAPATRRAYRADLDHFVAWGGTIPATDDMVAAYVADHANALKVSTLTRRLAAISIAHGAKGLRNPAANPLVRATMRGIRRAHGAAQR